MKQNPNPSSMASTNNEEENIPRSMGGLVSQSSPFPSSKCACNCVPVMGEYDDDAVAVAVAVDEEEEDSSSLTRLFKNLTY